MSNQITAAEVDAKLATVEAKTDTKFAQLIGRLDTTNAEIRGRFDRFDTRLDSVERSTGGVKATVIGAAIGTVAIVVGILAFGQQWFSVGLTTRDIIKTTISEMKSKP